MKGRRIVLYLVLPALLLLAAVSVVTQDFFGDQGVDLGRSAESFASSGSSGQIYIQAEIFSDVSNPDTVYLALTQATVPANPAQNTDDFFCLHGIYVTPVADASGEPILPAPYTGADNAQDEAPIYRLEPPLCNFVQGEDVGGYQAEEGPNSDLIVGPEEPLELFLDEGARSIRFYPFDTLSGRWNIYPLVLAPDESLRQQVGLDVHLTAELADWEEKITLRPETVRFEADPTHTIDWQAQLLQVQLNRTRTQRLLTLVLLGFLTVLILGLIFVRDNSALLETVIGILLGLWGIQAVVIPSYIQSRTLVHYWIIILYILLGLVSYIRLVGLPLVRGVDASEAIASLDDELEPLDEDEDEETAQA